MATREENLKKINDELEQLSDEELEQVSGGSMIRKSVKRYLRMREKAAEAKKARLTAATKINDEMNSFAFGQPIDQMLSEHSKASKERKAAGLDPSVISRLASYGPGVGADE